MEIIAAAIVAGIFLLSRWQNMKLTNERHEEITDELNIIHTGLITQRKQLEELLNRVNELDKTK